MPCLVRTTGGYRRASLVAGTGFETTTWGRRGTYVMADDLNDTAAVLDAFEQAPAMLAFYEGDPLVVTASNAMARSVLGAQVGDRATAAGVGEVGTQRLVDLVQQVMTSGQLRSVEACGVVVAGAQGEQTELLLDVVARPCFSSDGSVRGVATVATVAAVPSMGGQGAQTAGRGPAAPVEAGRELTTALQDAILPASLPVTPGAQIAARYLLAQSQAGGGWFDAVALDDGRVVLVVGDVVGHGIGAAVVMGELRAIFDERVRVDGDLGAALRLLDQRAQRNEAARASTVCAAVLDPATGVLRYATAGHPPPLVVCDGDHATYLPASGGTALGAGGPFPVSEHQLAVDDLVLLYSDGLVEGAGHPPGRGTVQLARLAASVHEAERAPGGGADAGLVTRWCERLMVQACRTGCDDDIVLLALRRTEPAPPLDLTLVADDSALAVVRRELRRWLARVGVAGLDETVLQHSLGELVGNAVEHGYSHVEPDARPQCRVRVQVEHRPGGLVDVTVTDQGDWREPSDATDRGRGLAMVQGFCDELDLTHGPSGTTVRVRHRPRVSAELLVASGSARQGERRLEFEHRHGELLVHGPVDAAGADRLRRRLATHTQGGTRPLLLDLTDATLLGSGGVQAVLDLLRLDHGLRVLAPLGSPAQHVLELARLPYATRRTEPDDGPGSLPS